MCRWIRQRIDHLYLLDDRARPSVLDDHRKCFWILRAHMNEVNVQPVDVRHELRQRTQSRLALVPIVIGPPIARELLSRRQLHALRCIGDRFPIGPLCRVYAFAQIGNFRFRKFHMKRTNSCVVSHRCSTSLSHGVLLLSSVGFRMCKCLAEQSWAERDCQTQHRTRLQKATARFVLWLFHGVLLSSCSGFLSCAVIVSSLSSRLSVLIE